MKPLISSAIIFALTLSGIYLGTLLRRTLPRHHLNEGAREVVRLGVGLIATITALVLGLLITSAHAQAGTEEPFGLSTIPVAETAIAATWKELLVQIKNDLAIVAKCREQSQSCSSPAAVKFVTIAKEGDRYEGLARIGHLNRAANFAIRALDSAHADDEWRSPLAILSRSSGDCKHHALLKYAMLREIGISPDALKIIVVEVRSTHQLHAILVVRAEKGRWLVLDNRTLVLVESSMVLGHYDPLYELDQNGVREFAMPSRSPQVAQSLRATQTR